MHSYLEACDNFGHDTYGTCAVSIKHDANRSSGAEV